jgi:D-amino-acid oxidase
MIKDIVIVGAGISGMSTAYLLTKKGYQVSVHAAAFSPDITSNKAAAFWFPYHIRNDRRGIDWCTTSYNYYQRFAEMPETGVSFRTLNKVLRQGITAEEPLWIDFMPAGSLRIIPEDELAPGIAIAYEVTVPLIETQIFLPWLQQQLQQQGVLFIHRQIDDLNALANEHDLVINCSGLGARKLCGDENIIPVRGQVGLLAPLPGMPIYLDNEKPLYIVPRKDAIIVGGTYEPGIDTAITEPEVIQRLLQNAFEVFPQLKKLQVTGSWAGIRPYRDTVRVEREPAKNIIHNYGHGGSGFTLAFGCAETVCGLV